MHPIEKTIYALFFAAFLFGLLLYAGLDFFF